MAYTAWSVVFGETPSASKWNILGTNDAGFNDGTAIGNLAIIARHMAANSVLPAALGLSSAFTGGVATQANAGTAGGTMYYINLGGLKLLWGRTAVMNGTGVFGVTFPTSFFTTVQAMMQAKVALVGTGLQTDYQQALSSNTGGSFVLVTTAGGAGNGQLDYFVLGT